MSDQWVVLELSSKADGEDPDLIRRSIAYIIKGAEVFVPAAVTQRGEDRVVHYLVDGYAFIRHVHTGQQYGRLENSKYIQAVVTRPKALSGGRTVREFATVSTRDIDKMKRQIHAEVDQGIGEGDTVLITSGAYKAIEARVIEDIPENDTVQVHVLLRSKDTIVSLPRSFLRLVKKAPKPPAVDRFATLREWFNDSYDAIVAHSVRLPEWGILDGAYQRFDSLHKMVNRFEHTSILQNLMAKSLSAASLLKQWERLSHLLRFSTPWDALVPAVLHTAVPDFKPIEDRYLKLMTIMSYLDQLGCMGDDVRGIEEQMETDQ